MEATLRCEHLGATYNPLCPAHRADPYPVYERARREQPIFFSERFQAYVVSRYDDVCAVLKDTQTYSSMNSIYLRSSYSSAVHAVLAEGYPLVPTLVNNDPPGHTRFRDLVSKAFAARNVEKLEPRIVEVAEQLVDGFAAKGEAEIIRELAFPLPGRVIAETLGVPADDVDTLKRWTDDWVLFIAGHAPEARQVECARSIVAMQHYFAVHIEQRAADPRDDLLTHFLRATRDGDQPLSRGEIICAAAQLYFAGHETTTSLIGSALRELLGRPELLARVRREPGLTAQVIEETLRLEAPIQGFFRVTTRETKLGGVELPKGARLQILYASANRDERRFPDPAQFDPDREDAARHLSFGRGIHHCIGASLARVQGRVALDVLLGRLRNLRLKPGQELSYVPSFQLRALERLELAWDPAPAQESAVRL